MIMKPWILLRLVSLILFPLGGEANIQNHKNALLHESVSISYSPLRKIGTTSSVSWEFGNHVKILDNTSAYYKNNPRIRNRLLMSDDLLTLTIVDLTMEDSGIYTVVVVDINGNKDSNSFHVTVYEPIPAPSLKRNDEKDTTIDRCNVTLNCSVPSNTSDLSYTWQSRQGNSKYQMYNNGSIIQISLQNDSVDMEFLCIVQNPADKKNVSIQVQDICKSTGQSATRRSHLVIISVLITASILAIMSAVFIMTSYKARKEPKENKNAEMHYIEVTTHQREGNQKVHMENDTYIGVPSPAKTKAETVYTTLQHPQSKFT